MRAPVAKLAVVSLAVGLVALSTATAAPRVQEVFARSSTTKTSGSASVRVHSRDDPKYKADLRRLRKELAQAQYELREAREAISEDERFLAPFREEVADARAALAELDRRYLLPFRAFGVRVRTTPSGQRVELEWLVRCDRGRLENEVGSTRTANTPFEAWRPPTLKRYHSCHIRAFTTRASTGRTTTIVLGRR